MSESDDLRTFIREITLRFERGMDRISREIRADVAVVREENRHYFEALDRRAEEESRRTDDLIAESTAQRQALLHILDEMRGGDGGTAPAAG